MIWALSPIYYRQFVKKFGFHAVNVVRTSTASAAMLAPAVYFGFRFSIAYALLSGVITLALGDSLFLVALNEIGASIATPVIYTYVLVVQLLASSVGEKVGLSNFVSALLVIAGITLLSRRGSGEPRLRGIAIALAGGLMWAVGQTLVKVALDGGSDFVSVAFARNASAAAALGAAYLLRRSGGVGVLNMSRRELCVLGTIAVCDLALGSTLFVYSISIAGVAVTTILVSVSPFLTQMFSRLLGKEQPGLKDMAGGVLVVVAFVIAVLG